MSGVMSFLETAQSELDRRAVYREELGLRERILSVEMVKQELMNIEPVLIGWHTVLTPLRGGAQARCVITALELALPG